MERRKENFLIFCAVLGLFALLFAVVLQAWLAGHLSLWGDETDTMAPAFRVWKGHKDFLWQIGQYNANPPGDNLVLRWYFRSDALGWLRERAETFYWRVPYVLVYAFVPVAAFIGVLRWTGSALFALLASLFIACAPGVFVYGTEVRFYIWEAFFVTVASLLAMRVLEEPFAETKGLTRRFVALSAVTALGICFHLMLVPVGYLVAVYALACLVKMPKRFMGKRALGLALVGFFPVIIYFVELKHWIFVPRPWKEIDPLQRLFTTPLSLFLDRISVNLPFQGFWRQGGLVALATALGVLGAYRAGKRRWSGALQAAYLLVMIGGTPLVLFYAAAARNYPLNVSHCVYLVPLVAIALVYLLRAAAPRKPWALAKLATAVAAFAVTLGLIADQAYSMRDSSPAKVNFPMSEWRDFYRREPGRGPLFVVGANLETMFADSGEYVAGMVERYTKEFSPYYISKKGSRAPDGKPISAAAFTSGPRPGAGYLFLELPKLKPLYPKFRWNELSCFDYEGGKLSYCRLRQRASSSPSEAPHG
jgi:hypothetical protein